MKSSAVFRVCVSLIAKGWVRTNTNYYQSMLVYELVSFCKNLIDLLVLPPFGQYEMDVTSTPVEIRPSKHPS